MTLLRLTSWFAAGASMIALVACASRAVTVESTRDPEVPLAVADGGGSVPEPPSPPPSVLPPPASSSPLNPACPDSSDPRVHYVSEDAKGCMVVIFDCSGLVEFSSPCGCGCIQVAKPDAGTRRYVVFGAACATTALGCTPGERPFGDAIGCGCETI